MSFLDEHILLLYYYNRKYNDIYDGIVHLINRLNSDFLNITADTGQISWQHRHRIHFR